MAKRIYLKEDGLSGSGPVPVGYKQIGYEGATFSEKSGFTSSTIGGGSEWIETIVNISSSQILNMGTTPIELLPASGENKYYDIESIILESNQPQYDLGGVNDFIKVTMGFIELTISRELLEANGLPRVTVLRNFLVQSQGTWGNYPTLDTYYRTNNHDSIQTNVNMILFLTENPTNPENCNGTLRAIIKYKVKTFGE